MAKYTLPQDVQIRALDEKKKAEFFDLMAAGPGVPWEDRGSIGILGGFFKTAFGMMFAPVQTLNKLRRPETAEDANAFAWGIAVVWFLAMAIQSAFDYLVLYRNDAKIEFSSNQYMINTALEAVAAAAGAVVLCRIISVVYYKLLAFDMGQKCPPVLAQNIITYSMSPSLLALIPGSYGPIPLGALAALLWMLALWIAAARGRLHVRAGGSIVGPILTFVVCCAMIAVASVALWAIWVQAVGNGSIAPVLPPSKTGR
jgi:hypothetical protein